MTYSEVWNYLVKCYNEDYNVSENVIQNKWEQYFSELFGYSRLFGDVVSHRSITIGSGQRTIPDIIIRKDGNDLFDVELKQYNLSITSDMENQLKSYMDLLHLKVGILICRKIYVYIYDFEQSKLKSIEIPFIKDNYNGIKLIELLQKENYSKEKIEEFIDSNNNFYSNVSKIRSDITTEKVIEIIKKHYTNEFLAEEVDEALADILVEIKNKKAIMSPQETQPSINYGDSSTMDYSRYIFNGKEYGKGRLVLAVVKAYVQDNPSITYTQLKTIFYDKIQGSTGVVATIEEAKSKRRDYAKRYYVKEPIFLDQKQILVCTQWGIGNIDNFINKAMNLGYFIEKQ